MDNKNNDRLALYGLLSSLGLSPAMRNDQAILEALEKGEPVDHIQGLNEAGLMDPFFEFLEEANIFSCVKKVSTLSYRRVMVPIVLLVLTYMTKILIGVPSMNALPDVLFSKVSIMRLLGFNAHILENGLCRRGEHARKNCEPPKPFSPQMLANFIERISPQEVETFFNNVVNALARFGVFPKELTAIMDGSDLETTEQYEGCGRVRRDKEVNGKTVEVTIFGFKIIAVMDLHTQIPLAVKVVKISERETNYTIALLKQAKRNLGDYSQITHLVFDRGFLDGQDFYALDQMGITFIIPAKSNMAVYHDARSLAAKSLGIYKERKNAAVTGIEGLTTFDSYCAPEQFGKTNRKDFTPQPINAVVVNRWNDKVYPAEKGPVFLTNGPVRQPLKVYDRYDDRSIIENLLFRESKQGWHLCQPPKKSYRAMVSHAVLTMVTYALTMAYRDWEDNECYEETSYRSFDHGFRRWKRKKVKEYLDYVIIFVDEYYGIFHLEELAFFSGIRVRKPMLKISSKDDVYRRRGLKPPK